MSKNPTYLVTGAAGFIGARFVESCNLKKISVISVDHSDFFHSRPEHKNLNFGEMIDRKDLFNWLSHSKPQLDAIIHLGAISDTRTTDLQLLKELNLDYSKNLWLFASTFKIPFLYASSAATYGNGEYGYDDLETLIPNLKPLNAYGESKQQFDLWALDQEAKSYCPPNWAGFKFFNVYGFGESHKGFMASVALHSFLEIKKSNKVTLFKSHRKDILDGFQKRDFIFVRDVIDVLHFSLQKPIERGIYNLGTGQARPFVDLAKAVFNAMNVSEQIHFIDTPESIREKYQYFTEAKMEKLRLQGFKAAFTSLEKGIELTIQRLLLNQA